MKHRHRVLLALLVIAAISCAANRAAFTTVGSVKIAEDAALKAWVQNVVTKGRCVASATVSTNGCVLYGDEVKVRDLHMKYQQTAATLMVVLEASNTNPAPQALSDAEAAVVSLVEQLLGKKVTP